MTLPPPDFPYPFIAEVLFTPEEIEQHVNKLARRSPRTTRTPKNCSCLAYYAAALCSLPT